MHRRLYIPQLVGASQSYYTHRATVPVKAVNHIYQILASKTNYRVMGLKIG